MFYGLRPVREGFGMKLMKRMGWREGEPLGKAKEGHIEPIPVDVKTDRQGIVVVYTNSFFILSGFVSAFDCDYLNCDIHVYYCCIGLSTEEDKVASVVSSTTVPASDQTPTCLQGNVIVLQ